jgi:hypothetical protein
MNASELLAIQLQLLEGEKGDNWPDRTGPDQMYLLIGLWIGLQMYGNWKIAPTDVHYNIGTDKSTRRDLLHRK